MFIKRSAISAVLLVLASSQAKALTTYNFDGGGLTGLAEVILTQDDIILTISNFVSSTNLSKADSDGLCFSGNSSASEDFCQFTSSLQLQFNKSVKLVSYLTGFNDYEIPGTPSLTFSQGSFSSLQTSFPDWSSQLFTNQFIASANTPILITNNIDNSTFPGPVSSLQFRSLTVEAVEDVPGPLPLMGAACAFGYSRKLRRRIFTSRPNS
ncbi:hypothetical protein [Synechococcus sp. CBW1004]|uniref:hypothetical protein n=1 Tax=Synechococcus sp. CBW1004 TaxID=1353136 RepID=UPI0018CE8719|nr:hypothetical protein [Synechococcus sp. CBW1004]QPN62284.1 hypothetical protein H8F25_11135 [Synechococcus sp. CBW1004]